MFSSPSKAHLDVSRPAVEYACTCGQRGSVDRECGADRVARDWAVACNKRAAILQRLAGCRGDLGIVSEGVGRVWPSRESQG